MVTMASMPVMTRSKVCWLLVFCRNSNPVDTTVVTIAPVTRGRPKSKLSATAPPTISARSVAMATSSAWIQ
jgi:hypothetical protein